MGGTRTLTASEVASELIKVGAVEVRTDPEDWFTWTSGRRSPIYCDNRVLISYPEARARVADALVASVRSRFAEVQVIAGAATAGIPHAAWVAERMNLPMVYVRGAAKEHGQAKRVEGAPLRGERVVLIEDTISTGGSALDGVEGIRAEGGDVLGVQAIFSYEFPRAHERFADAGIQASALTSYPTLLATLDIDEQTARILEDWRKS